MKNQVRALRDGKGEAKEVHRPWSKKSGIFVKNQVRALRDGRGEAKEIHSPWSKKCRIFVKNQVSTQCDGKDEASFFRPLEPKIAEYAWKYRSDPCATGRTLAAGTRQ